MSLRARLIAGLLALSTAGLVTLAVVVYVEQRSFLEDRLDEQARAAVPVVGRALALQGVPGGRDPQGDGVPGQGGAGQPGTPGAQPPGTPGAGQPGTPGAGPYGADPGPPSGGGPDGRPPPDAILPPATYGQRRAASGRVLGDVVLSYGQEAPAPPDLPAELADEELLTVPAEGGEFDYRVLAAGEPGGGQTIVALPTQEMDETLDRLLLVSGLVILAVLVTLALLAWWLVRLGLRPLDRMGATAGAIAAGDLSRRVAPATERTEVGRLGLALNGMLQRLSEAFARREASEERLRRFVADASHELRTPLASIRGYAEVLRTGAASTPEDRDRATSRIEAEAARMGVLVEDLLTLARLDEVRASTREDVDLAGIARDAVDDARATAPDRTIGIEVDGDAVVAGDRDRLRQVVGNLLRNALVHTPAGTPIEVAVRGDGDGVLLDVRDHGPGLPADDPSALFERFWRAEGGRRRGPAGAGLGLAIVAAIVDAHDGRATAENAPDGGARFEVRLPRAAPPAS